jgi:hypothetical protein
MILSQDKSLLPRCKVTKYILTPKTKYRNADALLLYKSKKFYASNIHIAYNEENATLYYRIKDVINFYNASLTYIDSLVTIYDYKNEKYNFWKSELARKDSQVSSESWYCVKAPNSNIYVVYTKWHSKSNKSLCVHNLSKNKNLHCVAYEFDGFKGSKLELHSHPDKYSYILANSFVVIYKIESANIYIYLVDLVSEKVDTIKYAFYDYLRELLHVLNDETDKEQITDMLSSQDFKTLINNSSSLWNIDHVECIMNSPEEAVPFIKFLKLCFSINAIMINFRTAYKPVYSALSVSFSVEHNKLSVQFATGTDGVIERVLYPPFKVNIPPDVILLSRKYDLDASYDISKSYPYYIYKVTQKYIFTRKHVFEQSSSKRHEYILNSELSDLYENYGIYTIDGINILKTKNNIMSQINDSYSKQKIREYIVGFDVGVNPKSITFVDLSKIRKFLKKEEYVDISSYTFDANIRDKIIKVMGMREKDFEIMEDHNRIFYHLLFDTTMRLLYILVRILPKVGDDSGGEHWLCKCDVRNPSLHCEVIARKHFYDYKNIRYLINIAKNNVHLLEITNKNIYDYQSSYAIHGRNYIYSDGLTVINNVESLKIKDIKQNRITVLNYRITVLNYAEIFTQIKSIRWIYNVYQQDDFLVCNNYIVTQNGNLISIYYLLVFTDLSLVKSIQIRS